MYRVGLQGTGKVDDGKDDMDIIEENSVRSKVLSCV